MYVRCCLHTCHNLQGSVMLGQCCHHSTVTECQVMEPKIHDKTINNDWRLTLNYNFNCRHFRVSGFSSDTDEGQQKY